MKFTASIGGPTGATVEIALESRVDGHVEAIIEDRRYRLNVMEVEAGVYWFTLGTRSVEAAVTREGEAYSVRIGERELSIEILEAEARVGHRGRVGATGPREVRAPMPGRVVQVLTRSGTTVEADQGLLVIEAMKMQNEIKSPKSGTVRNVEVEEGAVVSVGELLATIE